jgi:hypothetical protein
LSESGQCRFFCHHRARIIDAGSCILGKLSGFKIPPASKQKDEGWQCTGRIRRNGRNA